MRTYSLTVFDSLSLSSPLTKVMSLDDDGQIQSHAPSTLTPKQATRTDVTSLAELKSLMDALEPTQCLGLGVNPRVSVPVCLKDSPRPGAVPRTAEHFQWPTGGAILHIDIDGKHTPEDIPALRDMIHEAMPELAAAGQLWRMSSSAAAIDPQTGERLPGGVHAFILVDRGDAIPRIGDTLYKRLWLSGHGEIKVSKGKRPSLLDRTVIDRAIYQSNRLSFVAPPVMDGIERAESVAQIFDGPALKTSTVPRLTDTEESELARVQMAAKAAKRGEVESRREAHAMTLPPIQREAYRRQMCAIDRGYLAPATVLHFQDGTTVTAGEVRECIDAYKGKRLADPLEPDYHGDERIAMVMSDGTIHSFARGGRTFLLAQDTPEAPGRGYTADPTLDDRAIVQACYRHRMYLKPDALTKVQEETGAGPGIIETLWLAELEKRQKAGHRDAPVEKLATFDQARELISDGVSVLVLARLGSGKTTTVGAEAVSQSRRAIAATTLRSLTRSHARTFAAVHYEDPREMRNAAERVATTVHSLHKQDTAGLELLVLDEFATLASMLFDTRTDRLMKESKQAETLDLLRSIVMHGAQVVALDWDATPCAVELARQLGLRIVEVAESPYPEPRVKVMTRATSKGSAYDSFIKQALKRGERVVIATDSRRGAEKLGALYAEHQPLVIHAENAQGAAQAAFLEDPEAGAARHRLVIHSPSVGVGVSIVDTQAHVIVMQSANTLQAPALWQLARRWRRPTGGVIHWAIEQHLCRPQRLGLSAYEAENDIRRHADALGCQDGTVAGVIAATRQQILHDRNPAHAVIGHLQCIGVLAGVSVETEAEAVAENAAAREIIKVAEIEAVATAERVDDEQARHLPQTTEAQAKAKRHRIERGLALPAEDVAGELDRELVRDYLHGNLLSRVRRLADLMMRNEGRDLEAGTERPAGFAYQPHRNAQADLMLAMLDDLRNAAGDIEVTAAKAQAIAVKYRRRIRERYTGISQPVKDPSRTTASRWLSDLLLAWGHSVAAKRTVKGTRIYAYKSDPSVASHAERIASNGAVSSVVQS